MEIEEIRKMRRIKRAHKLARKRKHGRASDWLYLFLGVLIVSEIERKL